MYRVDTQDNRHANFAIPDAISKGKKCPPLPHKHATQTCTMEVCRVDETLAVRLYWGPSRPDQWDEANQTSLILWPSSSLWVVGVRDLKCIPP